MLSALRSLASTWVAKALFVLLVGSFTVWGIGDSIRNIGRDSAIARVDGQRIEFEEAQLALRRELQRLTRQVGEQFVSEPSIRRALAEQAVQTLVLDRVTRGEAERLHIAVPDAALRDFVFALPAFRGPEGSFSRVAFDAFLRQNELTEGQFLLLVRSDLQRQQFVNAVRAGAGAPDLLARPLLRWQGEQRAAQVVLLPVSAAAEPAAPEEAALHRFHENNPERFSAPEYREATVGVMTAALLAAEVEVTEEQLTQAFEQRRAQYETPERRVLEQALLPDEAKAREIAATWRAGADLPSIAAAATAAGGSALDLGALDREGLPVPALAEAAFATPAGGIADPVRSDFGWHVLHVLRIEPPTRRTLAEVREELTREIQGERAADLAFERANRIEDAFAGGGSLAEVAQRFNLALATIRTDATGHDPEGNEITLPVIAESRAALLQLVFGTALGAPLRLQESAAGFAAIEVKAITAPALKPFEQVEAAVRAAWVEDQRKRAQETAAAALLAAGRAGRRLAEAATEAGLGSREVGGIRRARPGANDPPGPVPPELLAPLFELRPHEVTMVPTRDGFAVAELLEVTSPDIDADAAGLARTRSEVEQAMAQDLETQLMTALRGRADIRIDTRQMQTLAQP